MRHDANKSQFRTSQKVVTKTAAQNQHVIMKSYSVFTFQKEIFDWNEQNQSITTWLHLLGFHFLFHEDGSEQRGSKYDDDSEQQSKFKDDDDSRGAWGQVNVMMAVISRGASKDDDDNDDDSAEHGGK